MSVLKNITIISGGQTGADRAALDFAIEYDIRHGGWCPRNRRAEDGLIPPQYSLQETPSSHYAQRTEWNVRDSDATLIFTVKRCVSCGTRLTLELAVGLGKPVLHLSQDEARDEEGESTSSGAVAAAVRLRAFLNSHQVRILNVAGPRASQEPAIADFTGQVLRHALDD